MIKKVAEEQDKKRLRMKSAERRALILERAKEVFARHSYAEASTSLLAQESGVTEPMLYRHFGSKKGLFLAVLREYSARFFEQWQQRLAQREEADVLDALNSVVLDYHSVMASDPDIHRVLHQAVAEISDPEFGARVAAHNAKVAAQITELVTRAAQAGLLAPDIDVRTVTWGYLSMIYTMQYSYVLRTQDQLSCEMLAKVSQTWLRGVLRER